MFHAKGLEKAPPMSQAAIAIAFHAKVKKGKARTVPVFHRIPRIAKVLKVKGPQGYDLSMSSSIA